MKRSLLFLVCILLGSTSFAEEAYIIETSIDHSNFLINGIPFAAKSYCYSYELGDQVIFASGNPDGSSSDAILINMRTDEACEVWCQSII